MFNVFFIVIILFYIVFMYSLYSSLPIILLIAISTLILGHAKPSVISFTIGYINTVEGDRRSSEGRVGLGIYPMTKK
jgi:hypothetical protein